MRKEPTPGRSAFFSLTVLACALYVLLLAFAVYASARYFGVRKQAGWSVVPSSRGWIVSTVDAAGPAADRLAPGDRLLAIDDDGRSAVLGVFRLRDVNPGQTYRVDVERRGRLLQVELTLGTAPGNPLRPIALIYSLVFFVCGAVLRLVRPQEAQVRLFGATMMMVGAGMLGDALFDAGRFVVGWERSAYFVTVCFAAWAFPMAYHFFSRFPTWRSPSPLWHGVQWLLYAGTCFVIWPAWVTVQLVNVIHSEGVTRFFTDHPAPYLAAARLVQGPFFIYLMSCLALALLVMARNYRRLRDAGSRRRIRWVVAGMALASIPWLALLVAYFVAGWMSADTYTFLYQVVSLLWLFVPASVVVAVWKEQLFDIKVLVRRGLQYLLARNALRGLLVLPFAVLALSILRNPNRTLVQILGEGSGWLNVVWIGAVVASLKYRQPLERALDRRFFREAYEQEQVLLQLIGEVREQHSISEIARLLSARIDSVLHPTAMHVFYRAQEQSAMVAGHTTSSALTSQQLSEQHALLRLMDGVKSSQDCPADFETSLPENEQRWLRELGVRLLVPIPDRQDRLVGLLLLGERMSDEPYSATDRRLLEGLAAQIGVVYENQYLQDKVRMDADVRRHVLARLDERSVSLLKECPACGRCYDSVVERCQEDGAEVALTLPIERTLDGKYRLDRALGRGGMGAVYKAGDLRLQRRVAVKVMTGSLFGDRQALRRFEREARAAARLDHANITRVHDYGTIGSDGAYLVMEIVAGRTWHAELQRSGTIDPARAADWFRQMLGGLQVAHDAGIVHRDLKPENIMVIPAPTGEQLKIMDFGVARVRDEAGAGATETATVLGGAIGTLGYMAPETLSGGTVDARADLFAVGVMAVESLTGSRPFGGRTPQEMIATLLQSDYHLPGLSADMRALDGIVQRCLAKEPQHRYASAAELAADLCPALARCGGVESVSPSTPAAPTFDDLTR